MEQEFKTKKNAAHFKIIIIICIQNIFADNIFCRTAFKAKNYFMRYTIA